MAPARALLVAPPLVVIIQRDRRRGGREDDGARNEVLGRRAGKFLGRRLALRHGDVSGRFHEPRELRVRDLGCVHPEAVDVDPVDRQRIARDAVQFAQAFARGRRAHGEFATGDPDHSFRGVTGGRRPVRNRRRERLCRRRAEPGRLPAIQQKNRGEESQGREAEGSSHDGDIPGAHPLCCDSRPSRWRDPLAEGPTALRAFFDLMVDRVDAVLHGRLPRPGAGACGARRRGSASEARADLRQVVDHSHSRAGLHAGAGVPHRRRRPRQLSIRRRESPILGADGVQLLHHPARRSSPSSRRCISCRTSSASTPTWASRT
jgi:hypothetical protein